MGPFCMEGLSCAITGFMPGSGVTAECIGPADSGGTCNVGFPDPCPEGEYCDADLMSGEIEGTCTALPTDGEPCVEGAVFRACAAEHVCSEGTCKSVGRIGDPCDADEQCYSGNCDGGSCAEAPLCEAE